MTDSRAPLAQTTVTSLRVVEALDEHGRLGVTALAAELDLAKGTVHKHVTTLERLGYVVKEDREYRLGLGFLGVGVNSQRRLDVYRVGRGPTDRLSKATDTVASLMVAEHGRGRYAYRVPHGDEYELAHHEGDVLPLHATAGGKAILAYTPADRREEILESHGLPPMTEHTITDRDAFREELRSVRDTRTAYDREELLDGWHCVAAPITNEEGDAVAAVSVSAETEFGDASKRTQDVPGLVISTATAIENKLRSP
ncbi:IclR family transcriptional regulator [Halogeometricum limi]|nr:IclR family transcriptional regulator [Halogeometricum limi]